MKTSFYPLIISILFCCTTVSGQTLKPGFDADEYLGVLRRCAGQVGKSFRGDIPKETDFDKVYQSPEMGLHNRWELWVNKDHTIMAINLRGTTNDAASLFENFYSAMIPATGSLKPDGINPVEYKFATDPKAYVHVGWTLGLCSMLPDITERLKIWHGKGIKQVIIEGHSQGGVLAFLLTSHIHYKMAEGALPNDLIVKTYCSAAPKPGNLYYAYDFDHFTRGGWAHNVVNAADWVPEMPMTVQTIKDLNQDPFAHTRQSLRKQNFLVRYYINHIYKKLDRLTRRTQRKYQKFLGRVLYKQVRKYMADLEQPRYAASCHYVRAGVPVVLIPDEEYRRKFPDTSANIFRDHLFGPYYYLVSKTYK